MDNLDIIQTIGSNSSTIAFTIYLLYQMRNDCADALRREIACLTGLAGMARSL